MISQTIIARMQQRMERRKAALVASTSCSTGSATGDVDEAAEAAVEEPVVAALPVRERMRPRRSKWFPRYEDRWGYGKRPAKKPRYKTDAAKRRI